MECVTLRQTEILRRCVFVCTSRDGSQERNLLRSARTRFYKNWNFFAKSFRHFETNELRGWIIDIAGDILTYPVPSKSVAIYEVQNFKNWKCQMQQIKINKIDTKCIFTEVEQRNLVITLLHSDMVIGRCNNEMKKYIYLRSRNISKNKRYFYTYLWVFLVPPPAPPRGFEALSFSIDNFRSVIQRLHNCAIDIHCRTITYSTVGRSLGLL